MQESHGTVYGLDWPWTYPESWKVMSQEQDTFALYKEQDKPCEIPNNKIYRQVRMSGVSKEKSSSSYSVNNLEFQTLYLNTSLSYNCMNSLYTRLLHTLFWEQFPNCRVQLSGATISNQELVYEECSGNREGTGKVIGGWGSNRTCVQEILKYTNRNLRRWETDN